MTGLVLVAIQFGRPQEALDYSHRTFTETVSISKSLGGYNWLEAGGLLTMSRRSQAEIDGILPRVQRGFIELSTKPLGVLREAIRKYLEGDAKSPYLTVDDPIG